MKKIMMMVVALLVSATTVNAQTQKATMQARNVGGKGEHAKMTVEEMAKKRTDGMIKRFGFPQDLYAKIYPLQLNRTNEMHKARATDPVDKAAMKSASATYKAGLQKVLTPAQFQQVKQAWAEARAKHKEGKGEKTKTFEEVED